LSALASTSYAPSLTHWRGRITAVGVEAGIERRGIGIEHTGALFVSIAIDVLAIGRETDAIEFF
jgi:hypothetical protein